MKILKWVLAVAGIAAVVAAAFLLFKFAFDARELIGAAQRYDSARQIQDPTIATAAIAGISLAAGVLLGLGLGLPTRTAGQVRNAALDEASARREAELRSRPPGQGPDAIGQ